MMCAHFKYNEFWQMEIHPSDHDLDQGAEYFHH